MDEAEVEEVIHLVERQKKRLHFAGSLLRVQLASTELRQLTVFHGLSDQELAKVPLLCCFKHALLGRQRCTASRMLLIPNCCAASPALFFIGTAAVLPHKLLYRHAFTGIALQPPGRQIHKLT